MKVSSITTFFTLSITLLWLNISHDQLGGFQIVDAIAGDPVTIGFFCTLFNLFNEYLRNQCILSALGIIRRRRRMTMNVVDGDDDEKENAIDILEEEEDETMVWETTKELCSNVKYDMKVLVQTEMGHLLVLATPSSDSHEVVDELCSTNVWFIHAAYASEEDKEQQVLSLLTHTMSKEDWMTVASTVDDVIATYDLHVQLTFEEIANGVDRIEYDPTTTYQDRNVPMNCATYLLELGKYWKIPITTNLVNFVIQNVQDTTFVANWMETNSYLLEETWFGRTASRQLFTSITTTESMMDDSVSMLYRLAEYMLEEQYSV